jgi:hypothetical protein
MKYIEEIAPGQCFVCDGTYYVLTIDFRSNNQKLCYDLTKGNPKWFLPETIVELIQIYTMDEKNTIIPIKTTEKTDKSNASNI